MRSKGLWRDDAGRVHLPNGRYASSVQVSHFSGWEKRVEKFEKSLKDIYIDPVGRYRSRTEAGGAPYIKEPPIAIRKIKGKLQRWDFEKEKWRPGPPPVENEVFRTAAGTRRAGVRRETTGTYMDPALRGIIKKSGARTSLVDEDFLFRKLPRRKVLTQRQARTISDVEKYLLTVETSDEDSLYFIVYGKSSAKGLKAQGFELHPDKQNVTKKDGKSLYSVPDSRPP